MSVLVDNIIALAAAIAIMFLVIIIALALIVVSPAVFILEVAAGRAVRRMEKP